MSKVGRLLRSPGVHAWVRGVDRTSLARFTGLMGLGISFDLLAERLTAKAGESPVNGAARLIGLATQA